MPLIYKCSSSNLSNLLFYYSKIIANNCKQRCLNNAIFVEFERDIHRFSLIDDVLYKFMLHDAYIHYNDLNIFYEITVIELFINIFQVLIVVP